MAYLPDTNTVAVACGGSSSLCLIAPTQPRRSASSTREVERMHELGGIMIAVRGTAPGRIGSAGSCRRASWRWIRRRSFQAPAPGRG